MGLKSEQQAFASHGLDFVTKEYLPEMLSEIGVLKR
jgi:DNA topoisomerase-6 subunit A